MAGVRKTGRGASRNADIKLSLCPLCGYRPPATRFFWIVARKPLLTTRMAGSKVVEIPPLPPELQRLCETEYPRFSNAEMTRRRAAIEGLMQEAGCNHLIFCGAQRFGSMLH